MSVAMLTAVPMQFSASHLYTPKTQLVFESLEEEAVDAPGAAPAAPAVS